MVKVEIFISLDITGKLDEGVVIFDGLEVGRFYFLLELLLDSLARSI
jgi:hypothetical protein